MIMALSCDVLYAHDMRITRYEDTRQTRLL